MKYVFLFLMVLVLATSCSTRERTELGDGYELLTNNHDSLLHQQGYQELWYLSGGQNKLVWPRVTGDVIVTNGLALFTGARSETRSISNYPSLFCYVGTDPVAEITDEVTRLWCLKNKLDPGNYYGSYVYLWPKLEKGNFMLSGHAREQRGNTNDWFQITLTTNELKNLVKATQTKGTDAQYQGVRFRIAVPEPKSGNTP